MTLVIQSNIPGQLDVWLVQANGTVTGHARKTISFHGSEWLMGMVDEMLKKKRTSLSDIRQLGVVRGPGPFTAVRTGLIVANTLSAIQHIPVWSLSTTTPLSDSEISQAVIRLKGKKEIVRPEYGREPNITLPRKQLSE